jgi:hypothetical protein
MPDYCRDTPSRRPFPALAKNLVTGPDPEIVSTDSIT